MSGRWARDMDPLQNWKQLKEISFYFFLLATEGISNRSSSLTWKTHFIVKPGTAEHRSGPRTRKRNSAIATGKKIGKSGPTSGPTVNKSRTSADRCAQQCPHCVRACTTGSIRGGSRVSVSDRNGWNCQATTRTNRRATAFGQVNVQWLLKFSKQICIQWIEMFLGSISRPQAMRRTQLQRKFRIRSKYWIFESILCTNFVDSVFQVGLAGSKQCGWSCCPCINHSEGIAIGRHPERWVRFKSQLWHPGV